MTFMCSCQPLRVAREKSLWCERRPMAVFPFAACFIWSYRYFYVFLVLLLFAWWRACTCGGFVDVSVQLLFLGALCSAQSTTARKILHSLDQIGLGFWFGSIRFVFIVPLTLCVWCVACLISSPLFWKCSSGALLPEATRAHQLGLWGSPALLFYARCGLFEHHSGVTVQVFSDFKSGFYQLAAEQKL